VESRRGAVRFVIRPFALADTPLDLVASLGCVFLLFAIFFVEILTPGAVVAAFALLPLAVSMWTLSGRSAALVMGAVVVLFAVAGLIETTNRLTLLFIAIPSLVLAAIVRLYAANVPRATVVRLAPPDDHGQPLAALTHRELEVARLAASAYTAAEIGHRLHIGERTVESHIATTYLKLGITSRSELIRMASRLG
jgi:DNA-binding CsgD family transcriptional regulator